MVVTPDVVRIQGLAFFVDRFRAPERRLAGGAGEAEDDLFQGLAGERLGLSGCRPKASAPKQAAACASAIGGEPTDGAGTGEGAGGEAGATGSATPALPVVW